MHIATRRRPSFLSTTLPLLLVAIAVCIVCQSAHASGSSNSTLTTVPANIFAGAPYSLASVNITATGTASAPAHASIPEAGYAVSLALSIHSPALQWSLGTAQFARSLLLTAPAAASVFAPSRMLDQAPWSVDVHGSNSTTLVLSLKLGTCIDPPRRSTSKGDQVLDLTLHVPPSATNPPLAGDLELPSIHLRLPQQVSSSVVTARTIIGAVFFPMILVCVLLLWFHDSSHAALELLWTAQIMIALADSPCSKHSFYSYTQYVFWMLRTAADARSIVPAVVHTVLVLVGILVSVLISKKAKGPKARLLHPKLGLFFVTVFFVGGIQSSMLLTIGGMPDYSIKSDTVNRGIGFVLLLVQVIASLLFCWSGIGSPALSAMHLEKKDSSGKSAAAADSSFWISYIWRPITAARRSTPIAGVFSPIAHLPRRLAHVANFLPFFVSLATHMLLAVTLSIDPNNIGGCVGTLGTCITIHLLYAAYIATGDSTCRSPAWATVLALLHFARALWCAAALLHLDCNGSVTDVDLMATIVSVVALVCVLVAAAMGIVAAKKEQPLTSNKLAGKAGIGFVGDVGGGSSPSSKTASLAKPLKQQQQDDQQPEITVTNASMADFEGSDVDASSASPQNSPSSSAAAHKKGQKKRKPLPPLADGTGERPASPLSGGLFSSPTFAAMMGGGGGGRGPFSDKKMDLVSGSSSNNNLGSPNSGSNGGSPRDSFSAALGIGGGGGNSNTSGDRLALRQSQLSLENIDASQRTRGQSLESRISSGSGGHEGPSRNKRSPPTSFGPTVPGAFCSRCGLPTRPNPVAGAGGQTLCPQCRGDMASAPSSFTTPNWDVPSHGQTGGSNGLSSSPSSSSNRVVLPSWEAPSQAGRGSGVAPSSSVGGIVQLPSWQQQQPQPQPSSSAQQQEQDLDDFL